MLESTGSAKEDVFTREEEVKESQNSNSFDEQPHDSRKPNPNGFHDSHAIISRNSFKERAKRKFSLTDPSHEPETTSRPPHTTLRKTLTDLNPPQDLLHDPAFNSAQIVSQKPPALSNNNESTLKDNVRAVATVVAHPKEAIKAKATKAAAGRISRAQRPVISPEEDRQLLDLHENLSRHQSNIDGSTTEQEQQLRSELKHIEDHRASLSTAWTVGRHVDRVRVTKNRFTSFPDRSAFEERDAEGNIVRIRWEKYIGYIALFYTRGFTAQHIDDFDKPAYDLDTLTQTVERIVMASAPLQAWWISSRQLYRWEDPFRTARWFALFIYLWYTDHIIGFFYAYILYIVIKERIFPSSVDSVRESLDRASNQSLKARAWGDLVEKHGREGWVEPLLSEVGPQILLQLGDLADYFEVLQNFYRWTAPNETAATLFFFFCCLLVTLLSDVRYCMKIVWFIVGFTFFLCWPLSSHYPQYRRLLDPFSWIIWDIPNDAERSLKHLQIKAEDHQRYLDTRGSQSPNANEKEYLSTQRRSVTKMLRANGQRSSIASVEDGHDSTSNKLKKSTPPSSENASPSQTPSLFRYVFRATEKSMSGKIVVNRQGIEFFSHSTVPVWSIPYNHIVEMGKGSRTWQKARPLQSTLERLELSYKDTQGMEVEKQIDLGRDERDEIFNLVIGVSGLRWRSMRPNRASREKDTSNQ